MNMQITALAKAIALLTRDDMHMYQDEMVQFIKDNPFCALFVDLGLGKTVSTMTAMLDLIIDLIDDIDGGIKTWLVIAPLRVANSTWPTELQEWAHTRSMTMAQIRDEDLVEEVNAAGQLAAKTLKEYGVTHPDVVGTIRRHRELELRRRAKTKLHLRGADITRYGRANIERAMLDPVTPAEKKIYVKVKRDEAACAAVRAHKARNPASIYVINREQVEFLVRAWGREWPYDGVVLDESSAFKDHTTKRWAALRFARQFMKRMIQLTATPAAETYAHLYGQIGLLDLGQRLGRTYSDYMNEFFIHNKYTFKYELRKGAEAEIAERISDITLTMKAEDYLPMKLPVSVIREVHLPDSAMRIYNEMAQEGIVELSGREIEAETAASMSQKLLQIASGVLYETYFVEDMDTDDMTKVKKVHDIHTEKIKDLADLVAEVNEPILVGYHFQSSLARLKKAFPKAVQMDKDGHAIAKWNRGEIPMLLLHPQAGAHGLNLQKGGRYVYFYDIPWSLELYLQYIGRLARQGQNKIVFVLHAVAKGTLDEFVVECMMKKKDAQDGLFKLLKRFQKKVSGRGLTEPADDL